MKKTLARLSSVLLIALFAGFGTANAATELIVNGSFENGPSLPSNGGWDVYGTSEVEGWFVADGAGLELRYNVAGTAHDGNIFAELDSDHFNGDTNSSIYQIISTTVGQAYELSFWYSPRAGVEDGSNGIRVFWGGNMVVEENGSGVGESDHVWRLVTAILYGDGSDMEIGFSAFDADGTSDTLGGSIDLVSLKAVPVPAAVWLFGSGLLGLVGYSRRKTA